MMRRHCCFVLIALLISACGQTDATVPVAVQFPALTKNILTTLSLVHLQVSASDMTTLTSSTSGPFSSAITLSADVPVGSNRVFTATAGITGDTTIGYQGSTTANVTTTGGSVPITMLYLNNATNSTAAVGGGPQISTVTSTYSGNLFTLTVNFASDITLDQVAGVVEFIPTAGGTARSQSIINELKGSVNVTMPSVGTAYMMFNGTGTSVGLILYNSSNQSVTIPDGATFAATQPSNTSIQIAMSTSAFQSLIDSAVAGKMNILVGSKANATVVLTPTTTSVFTASSAAAGASAGNVMIYDGTFNSSSL